MYSVEQISAESEGDAKGDEGFAVSRMGTVKRYHLTVPDTFAKRSGEYRNYLQHEGYKPSHIDKGFRRAALTNRTDLLKPKFKPIKKKYPLVLDFNPRLPDISKILKKHIHLISDFPALRKIFPKRSIIPAFRRTENLKELIAPSKFKAQTPPMRTTNLGFFTCDNKCDLCQNFSTKSIKFQSSTTGFPYKIKVKINCTFKNVIYLVLLSATYNILVPPPLNLKCAFGTTNHQCSPTKKLVN